MTHEPEPQTLREAHDVVAKLRPRRGAPLSSWLEFRRKSAAIYKAVADIDRYHHHEALYWVSVERQAADELEKQIASEKAANAQ